MVCIECVRREKFQRDFVAQNFALIAPVRPILLRVYCSNETVTIAPKHYELQQNMSFGSHLVYRVRS